MINIFLLYRIGRDEEEDNNSGQEENTYPELQTMVLHQEICSHQNEVSMPTDIHANGQDYVFVDDSTANSIISQSQTTMNTDEE